MLLKEGHDVIVLDNLSSGYQANLDPFPEVEFVTGDVRNAELIDKVVKGQDAVLHLAASVGNYRSIQYPIDDSQINIIGTLHILEAMRKYAVGKIVFSSSAGIFGQLKTLPIDENHPVEPDSPYGASKLGAEKLCLSYSKLYGLDAIALRYFNVYGVNQRFDAYGNVIPIFAHRMFNNKAVTIYGDGEQTRDFINVDDVVQANYKALWADGVSGAFNIASGTSITINHLIDLMKEVTGLEPHVQHGPERLGDVRHSRANVDAAKQAFGFKPIVDLKTGLTEYMQWAKPVLTQ